MVSYEERKANEKKLRPLAIEVAAALGWEVERKIRDYDHYVQIHGPNGETIGLSTAREPGKLHVSAHFPDTDRDGKRIWSVPYGETSPSINVSMSKTSAQIARDIERRFMPEYTRLFALCKESRDSTIDFRARTLAAARVLASSFGAIIEGTPDDVRINLYHSEVFPGCLGDIKVNSQDSIQFDRFSVSLEEAHAMLAALQVVRNNKKVAQ